MLASTGAVLATMTMAQSLPPKMSGSAGPIRYVCSAELATSDGRFFARRELDAMGQVVSGATQWVEGPPGDFNRWMTVWIDWPPGDGVGGFDFGLAHMQFDTDRSWNRSVRIGFWGAGKARVAGLAKPNAARPHAIATTITVADLMLAASDSDTIDLLISGQTANRRPGPPIHGRYSMRSLRDARSKLPLLIEMLAAMRADFRKRCTDTGASMLAKAR